MRERRYRSARQGSLRLAQRRLSGLLPIVGSQLAAEQIRIANDWWGQSAEGTARVQRGSYAGHGASRLAAAPRRPRPQLGARGRQARASRSDPIRLVLSGYRGTTAVHRDPRAVAFKPPRSTALLKARPRSVRSARAIVPRNGHRNQALRN